MYFFFFIEFRAVESNWYEKKPDRCDRPLSNICFAETIDVSQFVENATKHVIKLLNIVRFDRIGDDMFDLKCVLWFC